MCKSAAQGGRRCNGHLTFSVNHSVAVLSAAVSPPSGRQCEVEIARLIAVNPNPAPASREDIDGFLATQIEKAETCDSLTTKQRAGLIGRLHTAVGRLKTSVATLAAWRTVAAQAWSKTGRKVGAIVLGAALAVGVGGCGGAGHEVPQQAPSAAVAASAPEVQEYATNPVQDPDVSAVVANAMGGPGKAQKAYQAAATAFLHSQFDAKTLMIGRADMKPGDFEIRAAMTPDTRAAFDNNVTLGRTSDAAYGNVITLAYVDGPALLKSAGESLRTDVPHLVTQKKISNSRLGFDTKTERMKASFTTTGTIRIIDKNGHKALNPYREDVTLWITNGGKIDGYEAHFKPGGLAETPDKW